ncbi:MAG: CopG family transcriptional regulator [Verrucomicrobiae bacterium]|nr:CopG family transcriptional regulator [Verrucomicrobiae bacterium]MCB1088330.1 CopG family transcriptional regulator [Verrucomicrobiae bacterium]
MQTTLDLDDDVLAAAEEISALTHRSAGKVLSDLARRALTVSKPSDSFPPAVFNGFEIIPAEGRVVTPELVRDLMDECE